MRDLAAQAEPDTHDAAEKLYASVPLRGELLVSSNSSARSAQQLRKWKQRSKSEVFEKCQIWREMKYISTSTIWTSVCDVDKKFLGEYFTICWFCEEI